MDEPSGTSCHVEPSTVYWAESVKVCASPMMLRASGDAAARNATHVLVSRTSATSTTTPLRRSSGTATVMLLSVSVPGPARSELTSTVHVPSTVPAGAVGSAGVQMPPTISPVPSNWTSGTVPSGTPVQVTPSSVCSIVSE